MATTNRAALQQNLWPGIRAHFGMEYGNEPKEYVDLFEERSSDKAYEEMVLESAFGLAPAKAEGAPITFDAAANVWTARFVNETHALGFIITREAIEDDQYFDWSVRGAKALKRSLVKSKEINGAAVYNNGFDTNFPIGDGESFFSTTHPLKNGGALSNRGTADLDEASLEAAIITIGEWTDERGLLINVKVRKLVVPMENWFVASRILGSPGRPSNGTAAAGYFSDINVINRTNAVPDGHAVNHYLTDPDSWVLRTDAPDGALCFNRRKLDIEEGEGMDNQVLKVVASERYSFGVADWRTGYASPGSG